MRVSLHCRQHCEPHPSKHPRSNAAELLSEHGYAPSCRRHCYG
ncbi:hypothetical protein [Streptomyces sp. 1222.5]